MNKVEIHHAIVEVESLSDTLDSLIPRVLKLAKHRLRASSRNHSRHSEWHDTLYALKRELADYNASTARWKR